MRTGSQLNNLFEKMLINKDTGSIYSSITPRKVISNFEQIMKLVLIFLSVMILTKHRLGQVQHYP